jgi:glycosyltransferase involved in cell wall biosynthesis/tetratricopeptide (TPR) repeat protein
MIASLLMLKYADFKAAMDFATRSVDSMRLSDNETLCSLLDQTLNGKSGIRTKDAGSNRANEFQQLVETATHAYGKGQSGMCAKACARLSEIAPEELETLVLVGLSLARWGDARAGQTAFRCLVQRYCEHAFLDATKDVNPTSPKSGNPVEPLAEVLSNLIGNHFLPNSAIEQTLNFIGKVASASQPHQFLLAHLSGQTPLFFAILGLNESELSRCVEVPMRGQIRRVASVLQSTKLSSDKRESGYSFCIITNGKRPAKLLRQIESIRALRLPHFEILVGGEVGDAPDGVRKIDLAADAQNGRLGKMRNALARKARFDHLIISDDDMIFDPNFANGLKRFGEGYEAMGVRIENPDSTRFWDWAATGGTKGATILPLWESDPDVYLTGGFCVLKADLLSRVAWDEVRGFYEGEDVDFSTRLRNAGVVIRFNPFCKVVHDDDRYTRVDNKVVRFDHMLEMIEQHDRAGRFNEAEELSKTARRVAGNYPDRISALEKVLEGHLSKSAEQIPTTKIASPKISSDKSTSAISVAWVGTFLDHGSLSGVNRSLASALKLQADLELHCVQSAPVNSVPDSLKFFRKEMDSKNPGSCSVTIRHAWPPDWSRPKNGKLVVIQPWEFGSLPTQWVEQAKHVDEFWVPSNYVRNVYVDSGVDAEKVFVVPNGVDSEKFHSQALPRKLATSKKFKFLFVGGTIFRKGPDLLLKAYLENFTASDDVCLVIKDFGGQSVYAGQTIEAQIRNAQSDPNAPEILYLNEELPPDSLPGLFTACDCFVLPYRGEGFGLPALEAMACGLPIIVTASGATDDFVRYEFAFRISAKRVIFGNEISGMKLVKPGWLLEPDMAELSRKMRAAFCNPSEAAERGRRASEFARQNYSWRKSAEIAAVRIRTIATQPPADRSRRREEADNIHPPSHVGGYTSAKPIELPTCAKLGHLAEARELLKKKQHRAAWENTIAAINVRPFHPEAFLLLAEIALAAGDSVSARRCAQHAHDLVPNWKPAKKFLKGNLRGNAKHDWLVLPEQIANQKSEIKNRLSVCLITKNEERFIAQCLKSVREIAQQIVVVDTGSTDRTVEIAKENGAEVFYFTWNDDFSAARNAALEHVTGDWVLVLDADEELLPEHRATILKEMQAASVMAYRLPIIDKGKENEGCSYVPRLFRNAPGLFFVGRVHEQVFSSIEVRCEEWGLKNQFGKAALLHHGYTQEIVASRGKITRNLRLLERAIEELPGEPSLLMSLGLELVRSKQLETGLERYWEALRVLEKKPAKQVVPELRETLLTQLSTHLMAAKRFDEIERLWEIPFAKSSMTASQHFLLGLAQMELKRPNEAAEQMRLCLSKRYLPALSPIHPEILRAGPNHCLALSLAVLKQNDEAQKAFRAALADDPQSRSAKFDFARFYAEQSNPLETLKLLHELIAENPDDVQAWQFGGQIALSQTDFLEFGRDWTSEAIKHFPEIPVIIAQRAEALLLSGEVESALPFWRKLPSTAKNLSALALCELIAGEVPQRFSAADENVISREFLSWYRKLIAANASSVVCALNERMDSLRNVVPSFVQIWSNAAKEAEQVCN